MATAEILTPGAIFLDSTANAFDTGKAFIDLQGYLMTALTLPPDNEKFLLAYPKDLFKLKFDKQDDTLYDVSESSPR